MSLEFSPRRTVIEEDNISTDGTAPAKADGNRKAEVKPNPRFLAPALELDYVVDETNLDGFYDRMVKARTELAPGEFTRYRRRCPDGEVRIVDHWRGGLALPDGVEVRRFVTEGKINKKGRPMPHSTRWKPDIDPFIKNKESREKNPQPVYDGIMGLYKRYSDIEYNNRFFIPPSDVPIVREQNLLRTIMQFYTGGRVDFVMVRDDEMKPLAMAMAGKMGREEPYFELAADSIHRRGGLVGQSFRHIAEILAREGVKRIDLVVLAGNSAMRGLLEKLKSEGQRGSWPWQNMVSHRIDGDDAFEYSMRANGNK